MFLHELNQVNSMVLCLAYMVWSFRVTNDRFFGFGTLPVPSANFMFKTFDIRLPSMHQHELSQELFATSKWILRLRVLVHEFWLFRG
jgi:hypothetical protein